MVGVDIGCGMRATRTSFEKKKIEKDLREIVIDISRTIPLGFKHRKEKIEAELFKNPPNVPVVLQELERAKHQVGTLGGGNHFLEIQYDEEGRIWLMVHSGSRNFGHRIASVYHKKALEINPDYKDLAFIPIERKMGRDYFDAMNYAVEFARLNRTIMLEEMLKILKQKLGDFEHELPIDVHHNFATFEEHFGEMVYLHRKGATKAFKGEKCIIPGSMGTPSYICEGLGNPESFKSCAHGAGRAMSRSKAKKKKTYQDLKEELDKKEIVLITPAKGAAPAEAPSAYKDIGEVMDNQKDLVKIVHKLEPIGVVIG
jgi:tRNA-splicing ligase RtcB